MYKLLTVIFILFVGFAQAQMSGTIYGNVVDADGFGINTADIHIEGTLYSVYTKDDGYFELEVESGTYEVVISALGYDEVTENITINSGERIELSVALLG